MISESINKVCGFMYMKLKQKKIKQREIAKIFHCSPSRVSQKLRAGDFTLKEMLMFFAVTESTEEEIGEVMHVKDYNYRL